MEEGFFLEKDRIPVFIGVAGGKKREIEKKFDCMLIQNLEKLLLILRIL
jgi:hypothetical protein